MSGLERRAGATATAVSPRAAATTPVVSLRAGVSARTLPTRLGRVARGVASHALVATALSALCVAASGCGDEPEPAEEADLGSGLPDRPPRGITPEEWGERLFAEHGCLGCHTLHGARSVGGSLAGIWGAARTFDDGSTGTVDEAYVRESIDSPGAKVVAGFRSTMPSYRQHLSQAQVDALVAFLATRR